MAKYEDTYSPSERFGDLEFTWDVDFAPLLSNTPEASQPSEYVKVRSPLTGTGEGTNLPEGVSAEDAYRAWNLGMKEYSTMGHHIGGGLPDFHHSKFLIDSSGPPLAYYYEDTTIGERLKGHVLRNEKNKIIEAAKKAGVDPNLLWGLWKNQEVKSDVSYLMPGAFGEKETLEEVVIGDDGKEIEIVSYDEGSPTGTKHIIEHEAFHGVVDRAGDEMALRGIDTPWIQTVLRGKPAAGIGGHKPLIGMDVEEITTRLFMVKYPDYSETFYTGFSEGNPTSSAAKKFKRTGSPTDYRPSQYDNKRLQMKGIYTDLLNMTDKEVDEMFVGGPNWIRMVKEFVYPFWTIEDLQNSMEGVEPESNEHYDNLEKISLDRWDALKKEISSMKGLSLQNRYRQIFKKEIKKYYSEYFGDSDG